MKRPRKEPLPAKDPKVATAVTERTSAAGLSPDEHALWRHVAHSVAPVRVKSRITRRGTGAEPDVGESGMQPVPPRRPARNRTATESAAVSEPPLRAVVGPGKTTAPTPSLVDFDPRKARKIGTGRSAIEARLDLHGLRQDEALGRLRAFLRDCHGRGLKTVLVITGKGRESDDPTAPFGDTLDRQPRGVLRRNVPRWLDEPELRAIVVSYTSAAQRHGGDGAFYIELRRRNR